MPIIGLKLFWEITKSIGSKQNWTLQLQNVLLWKGQASLTHFLNFNEDTYMYHSTSTEKINTSIIQIEFRLTDNFYFSSVKQYDLHFLFEVLHIEVISSIPRDSGAD